MAMWEGDISPKPLLSLRTWFIVAFVLTWNVLLLGVKVGLFVPEAELPITLGVIGGTSVLAFAISISWRLRLLLLEPSRRDLYQPLPFVFIGFVTAVLAGALAYFFW